MATLISAPNQIVKMSAPDLLRDLDLTDDEQIVAVCSRGTSRQSISILDLTLPDPAPEGAEWIEAFSHWACGR